ncbi:MAG: hypothetical protein LBQ40_07715 [Clostridiales bacterium]|jgi:hypothetical protein|nr:hypothetical protein [Clostridiales bacterium]
MDATTKASINLHAVLRNIQDLCEIDKEASQVVAGKKITVKFSVKGCEPMALAFNDGKCKYLRGEALNGEELKGALKLSFSSPEKFNTLIDGGKVVPMFNLLGIPKLGFVLKDFDVITKRLEYYLRPDPSKVDELYADKDYFKANTELLAYTAFHALAEIANYDPVGREIAHRMPDGVINVEIKDGIGVAIAVKDGRLSASIGRDPKPRAKMVFGNLDVVNRVLNGKTDAYSAMGAGLFNISGLIPLLDNMNHLLTLVAKYLG